MSFSYANPTSGPSAGGIGWLNFGNLTLNPGDTALGLGGTLNDGTVITFDLSYQYVSGQPRTFVAVPTPVFPGSPFGSAGYTGITGNSALYSNFNFAGPGVNVFTLSNITVKDSIGNPINNYTVVLADSETTNIDEIWEWNTNGGAWQFLALLGIDPPDITGINTQDVTISSRTLFPEITSAAYVLTSQSPTQLILTSTESQSGRQAFSIGFAITKLTLEKNIGARIDPADQFDLTIGGTPNAQATTTGSAVGIQAEQAVVYAIPSQPYTFNESMALGSVSALSDYTQTTTASNATLAGSIPPVGTLPITFIPAIGDDVTYTILNAAPQVINKTVNKAYADVGEVLTYTVAIANPNDFAVNNVQFSDATPAGTTYIGNLTVSQPYTGTDPASGLVITTIPANTTATITWQVQVNMIPPMPNPIPNYANIILPDETTGMSNIVTTQINTAFVSIIKMVSESFAGIGEILTYSFNLHNAGNVDASNIVITDILPPGTTFIPGSLVGATGTPPTLTIPGSISSLGNASVSFQVQLVEAIPSPNPVINNAGINFTYTVDPANPNGVSKSNTSNNVTTFVSNANVMIEKAVDKTFANVNDTLTYTITLTNTGNVDAANVVAHDALPSGVVYVANSLTGATGTPANMVLAAPIPANGTATISFQVTVSSTIPQPNPIINNAFVDYNFTIHPNDPNGQTGSNSSNNVSTLIQHANVNIQKAVDKAYANVNETLTYTLTLTNLGNVTADNVTINDDLPAGTTFLNGSLQGAIGTPPVLTLLTPINPDETQTISFQVVIDPTIPSANPLINGALTNYTYTVDPNNPDGASGASNSNLVSTLVSTAVLVPVKTADKDIVNPGDTITYTLTITNEGNAAANNVVIQEVLPAGISFVPGTLTGAAGTPPTLTLNGPIGANSSAIVTFDVLVSTSYSANQIVNEVNVRYTFTTDPTKPNGNTSNVPSNQNVIEVRNPKLNIQKAVDKAISFVGDIITYHLSVQNTGNVAANNAFIQEVLPNGLQYVNNSLQANVPVIFVYPNINITQPINPSETVSIIFQAKVIAMPVPNPMINIAVLNYTYIFNPTEPQISVQTPSNPVTTTVFRNPYPQQITDIIVSVALEEAALAAIANAEGAKIQALVANGEITTQQLLCLNKSVSAMLESISLLESILKQKISLLECQVDGEVC